MKAVGVCGKIGSGKDVVADYLVEKYGYTKVQLSDIMAREMKQRGIPVNRETFQEFTQEMKAEHGKGVWADMAVEFIERRDIEKPVIVGLRDSEEPKIFKKCMDFKLICVRAMPETRLARLLKRGSRKDITDMDGLKRQERKEAKIFDIYETYEKVSDFILDNDGTVEELKEKVDELIEKENLL